MVSGVREDEGKTTVKNNVPQHLIHCDVLKIEACGGLQLY